MKKKTLAMLLGIALVIQPCSTVIAADVQQNSETATIDENEANVEIPNEIETNEKNQKDSDIVLEKGTDKKEAPAEEVEKDTEKPVIHQDTLTIDKTEVTVGDVINISVKVTDNSALDRVILEFENLDNNNEISWKNMTYNEITGKYEYSLSIEETMVAGHWRIESIGAYDVSGNYAFKYPSADGESWDFYVKNDTADSEAPIIDTASLKINKKEFTIGDEIAISAKITDNVKVNRVWVNICNDSDFIGDSYDMTYNDNTGLFECTIKTDESWIGHKYVQSIWAYDEANNSTYHSWAPYDDNVFFVVTQNGEVDYDCEVVDLKCVSGEPTNYLYSYGKYDNVVMRIFDPSIVGYVDKSYGISNIGYEIGGVFTPYKEGTTTVELYNRRTGKVLKAYRIEVSPKEHFVCNEKEVKGTFLSSTEQNYSVLCDGQKIDANVTLVNSSEIIIGSVVRGQYEYEYRFAFNESGDKKVSIIGDDDNKEITLNIHVNSHQYSEPVFTWNDDNTCTVTYSCSNCNKTETDQSCEIVSTTTEATCTTAGKTVYTASIEVNGTVYSDVHEVDIPALGHQAGDWTVVKEATCTEEGKSVQKCLRCGHVLEEKVLSKVEHVMSDWQETIAPTCTSEGIEERTCTVCGENESRKVEALGHDLVETKVNPTCTEEGSVVSNCTRCDYSKKEMIPALGHKYGKWVVTKEPTFLEDGTKERTCEVCKHVEISRIPKLSESHEHEFTGDVTITKEPTCTEEGVKVIHCSEKDCTATITEAIQALGHQAGDWIVVKESTCTETGLKVKKCTRCDEILEERTIEKVDHTYGEGEVIHEATCLTGSETRFLCTVCGTEKVETGEPLGHLFEQWEVVKEATCTETGEETSKCERCDETTVRELQAKGHSFGEWEIIKKPTTKEEGCKERVCTVCGDKETETIDKLSVAGKPSTNTNDKDKSPKNGVPKSGDTSSIMIYVFGIIAASLLTCFVFVIKKKKR